MKGLCRQFYFKQSTALKWDVGGIEADQQDPTYIGGTVRIKRPFWEAQQTLQALGSFYGPWPAKARLISLSDEWFDLEIKNFYLYKPLDYYTGNYTDMELIFQVKTWFALTEHEVFQEVCANANAG